MDLLREQAKWFHLIEFLLELDFDMNKKKYLFITSLAIAFQVTFYLLLLNFRNQMRTRTIFTRTFLEVPAMSKSFDIPFSIFIGASFFRSSHF